jgi:hypothetical protein
MKPILRSALPGTGSSFSEFLAVLSLSVLGLAFITVGVWTFSMDSEGDDELVFEEATSLEREGDRLLRLIDTYREQNDRYPERLEAAGAFDSPWEYALDDAGAFSLQYCDDFGFVLFWGKNGWAWDLAWRRRTAGSGSQTR